MRCGGLSCRSTAVAAAASGGATMAPSAIAGAHGMAGISARATTATAMVVRPTANNHQTGDRRPVVPEVPRRRVIRRVEQDGRDEERQGELGQHGERRRAWNEREDRAAERQKHRIRRADAARHGCQDRGGEDQANENFEFFHLIDVASGPSTIATSRAGPTPAP